MANDAYQLQGRNGFDKVAAGQTFTGRSAGVLVSLDFAGDVVGTNPKNQSVTLSPTAWPIGFYTGGTVTYVDCISGEVLVYPESSNYTIA